MSQDSVDRRHGAPAQPHGRVRRPSLKVGAGVLGAAGVGLLPTAAVVASSSAASAAPQRSSPPAAGPVTVDFAQAPGYLAFRQYLAQQGAPAGTAPIPSPLKVTPNTSATFGVTANPTQASDPTGTCTVEGKVSKSLFAGEKWTNSIDCTVSEFALTAAGSFYKNGTKVKSDPTKLHGFTKTADAGSTYPCYANNHNYCHGNSYVTLGSEGAYSPYGNFAGIPANCEVLSTHAIFCFTAGRNYSSLPSRP
jgi:hypothetical protein